LEAIEERLTATAQALGAIKSLKMTGLTEYVSAKLTGLRFDEIHASRRYRVLRIILFGLCMFEPSFNVIVMELTP
jgi:hypothetical protein